MHSPQRSPQLAQYYSTSPSPFTRQSPFSTPLLGSGRRVSIRTPVLGSAPSGLPGVLRGRGRWRKGVLVGVGGLVLLSVFYVFTTAKNGGGRFAGGRFAEVGGFGADFMGREEEEASSTGPKRLPGIELEGGSSKLCLLFPWRTECVEEAKLNKDPFEGLVFREEGGRLYYPAELGPPPRPAAPRRRPSEKYEPPDPAQQPHPIHHLVREAKKNWKKKVEGQSKDLKAAITEYERRYGRRPPKGFSEWFFFAKANNFVMVDEFDLMMRQVEPYLAIKPSTMVKRHEKLQFDKDFWMQDKTFTIKIEKRGAKVEAHGPMINDDNGERSDQMLLLLKGIAKRLPNMNVTFTGHDVPWVVLSGENKQRHLQAVREGRVLSAEEEDDYMDDWSFDGWAQSCPPDSPLRRVPSFDERMKPGRPVYTEPSQPSFISHHEKDMDTCQHPERQLIHGFTSWPGPRSGLLYPIFVSTTTSMHSDLLIPPLDQYDRRLGNDPPWEFKKYDQVVWRGSTTGADLNIEHMREWSQRVRLCRLPFGTGTKTLPYAPQDSRGLHLGPVQSFTQRTQALAQTYFDFRFLGEPTAVADPQVAAEFTDRFLWDEWMEPDVQNEYKYMLDVDGNGWSGRFHRLMSTNSLVLKSTIFPEWYTDMIQPWVHYVPISTDLSDLWTVMAFFKGDAEGKGSHDAMAKEIASEGKRWAENHWRFVDMEIYMYRLLLEYARIIGRDDNNLHSMDL
ncbi:hypothetical protein JCM8547_003522 [Rhodosporidiobolus lusitaniae]